MLAGKIIGRYRLIELIGRGGMAAVYRAQDTESDRIVAVKILAPLAADDPQFVLRFRREARLLLGLRHPHIVPVEDFGEIDGTAFLVMPYFPTGSLAERLARGPLTPEVGGRMIAQICSALEFAHKEGIVHRDVKPSNILLDERDNAFLTDFGLAQVANASVSLTGSTVLGTPAYVSPEQVQAGDVDARSDQYSLGVLLYQMTTGRLPFEAATPMAVLIKHVNEPMPAPRTVSPHVPESVERVILKAAAKNPSDRFASMAEMNRAFQSALAHALDPRAHPAPTIPLGASSRASARLASARTRPRRSRAIVVLGALAGTALFLLLASPIASANLADLLLGSGTVRGSTEIDLSNTQRTDMARTQNAFATQLIGTWSGTLLPEEALTAAASTIAAEWGRLTSTAQTATETEAPPASTETVAPSPSTRTRTPTHTRRAQGSSNTPTSTVTPSQTPTPTPTSTRTLTRTASPSVTTSRTSGVVLPSVTSMPTLVVPSVTIDLSPPTSEDPIL